ncbi:MAG TPA: quinolinate synthase NadA [Planctomycetota bacterium]|nr:quinolinate synthase NadA [Planctomycetota bacterium]
MSRTLDRSIRLSGLTIQPGMPICQGDYPLDRYQEEFRPYAEEYLALPSRLPEHVLPWMDGYLRPALERFGPRLMLLAHYYMGGEIVKLVERYGGRIADSYELALQAAAHPEAEVIVESAVHFMAESIATLAAPHQQVFITNPRAGCTMELYAKEFHVAPFFEQLQERWGDELMVVTYMNTSGRIKALAGRTGGAVCTSSNAKHVLRWALAQGKRILWVPDRHLGEVACWQIGLPPEQQYLWPAGTEGMLKTVASLPVAERERLDRARVVLWGSSCGVHTVFRTDMVEYWRRLGFRVLVHPECTLPVVQAADGHGSTKYLWGAVMDAPAGSRLAIGTEGHFVRNAREQAARRGVTVVHLADIPDPGFHAMGCGCATMSRNDPPHLVALVDLLAHDRAPEINRVQAGDVVDEISGVRERLDPDDQAQVAADARAALERMVTITEAAG